VLELNSSKSKMPARDGLFDRDSYSLVSRRRAPHSMIRCLSNTKENDS
jgi:hypothetical protein